MKSNGTLVQFCKAPIPGRVKTRLTPFLSDDQACEIHKRLSLYIFQHLICSPNFYSIKEEIGEGELSLSYQLWIDQKHVFFDSWPMRVDYKTVFQQGDSLGDRLKFAAKEVLEYSDFVIFIGSDCPFITENDIRNVTTLLTMANVEEESDLVIIPADDGGYVLIAIKQMCNALFENIQWGSDRVLEQTITAAKAAGLSYEIMDSKPDIDRPEDLALLKSLDDFSFPVWS